MKPYLYTLLAAAAASGLAQAQTAYTTPVGYVTKTLAPSQFNLIGVTLHEPVVASGVIDAVSSSPKSVTDNQINFTTLLTAGSIYILELPNGVIQEITSWSGSVLTTSDDITASVVAGTTQFKLRKAKTVSSIFGANNSAGLGIDTDGSLNGTDFIQILNTTGSFDSVYYFNDGETVGWFTTGGDPADNKPIIYADGLFVKRASGSPISLVMTGEVKTTPTGGVLAPGFSYLSAVAPASVTLGNSGLQAYLNVDTTGDVETADLVQIQQPNGTYISAYFFNDGETVGWFTTGGDPADNLSLDGGFLIINRTGIKPYIINPPPSL